MLTERDSMPGYVPESLRRYTQDNEFRLLVDTLHSFIRKSQYTPGELRMAVHEACVQYENTRVTPRFILHGIESGRIQSSKPNQSAVSQADGIGEDPGDCHNEAPAANPCPRGK